MISTSVIQSEPVSVEVVRKYEPLPTDKKLNFSYRTDFRFLTPAEVARIEWSNWALKYDYLFDLGSAIQNVNYRQLQRALKVCRERGLTPPGMKLNDKSDVLFDIACDIVLNFTQAPEEVSIISILIV